MTWIYKFYIPVYQPKFQTTPAVADVCPLPNTYRRKLNNSVGKGSCSALWIPSSSSVYIQSLSFTRAFTDHFWSPTATLVHPQHVTVAYQSLAVSQCAYSLSTLLSSCDLWCIRRLFVRSVESNHHHNRSIALRNLRRFRVSPTNQFQRWLHWRLVTRRVVTTSLPCQFECVWVKPSINSLSSMQAAMIFNNIYKKIANDLFNVV